MSKVWKILEALFAEAKQYRGESGIPFSELNKMMMGTEKRPGVTGRPANPEGEAVDGGGYQFDPKIWGKWFPSQDTALNYAGTDDRRVPGQHVGKAQGDMSFKTTWSQRVVNVPGKARTDFERLPSAMDRYDVLMQADIITKMNAKGIPTTKGVLHRVAYSPSIGSAEERKARLMAMISGQNPGPLKRRPQPDRPELPKGAEPNVPAPEPVPKQGDVGMAPRAAAPERGSPERARWDAERAASKKGLGIPDDMEFTDWLKMRARKNKDD